MLPEAWRGILMAKYRIQDMRVRRLYSWSKCAYKVFDNWPLQQMAPLYAHGSGLWKDQLQILRPKMATNIRVPSRCTRFQATLIELLGQELKGVIVRFVPNGHSLLWIKSHSQRTEDNDGCVNRSLHPSEPFIRMYSISNSKGELITFRLCLRSLSDCR